MINEIFAIDRNDCFGNNNDLAWHYKEDLQYFKEKTLDKTCVMGEETFKSILSRNGKPLPRRTSVGIDYNRVNMLMAVLEKRAGLMLAGSDAYVNVAGGMKINEPAIDLGIVMALVSSFRNKPINYNTIIFGEVGLSGEVRGVSMAERRIKEAAKMGFTSCVIPQINCEGISIPEGMEVIGVTSVSEALSKAFAC